MNDDPTATDIERLLIGQTDKEETRRLVRKLAKGCPPSVLAFTEEIAGYLHDDKDRAPLPEAPRQSEWIYAKPAQRAIDGMPGLAKQWAKDCRRLAEGRAAVQACPGGWRGLGYRAHQRYKGWVHLELLWEAAFALRYSAPGDMLLMMMAGTKFAEEKLKPAPYGTTFVADLQARAWAELANAQRINLQLSTAEATFLEAWDRFEQGSLGEELEARINSLEASLLRAQRRIPEALSLLEETQKLYRRLGDQHLAARTLIQKGQVLRDEGRPEDELPCLREALSLLDPQRDPELTATTMCNLIETMVQVGQVKEAGRLLLKSDLRTAFADQPLNLLKLRWAEAKIMLARGQVDRAGEVFCEVREEFSNREQHYDAALVALDEAAFWLSEGDVDGVQDIVEEAYETFRVLGISREATKALYFLFEACRYQVVSEEILTKVRSFFLRVQRDPRARFEIPA